MEPTPIERAGLVTIENCADWANLTGDSNDQSIPRGGPALPLLVAHLGRRPTSLASQVRLSRQP